jgi:hypothetical protein
VNVPNITQIRPTDKQEVEAMPDISTSPVARVVVLAVALGVVVGVLVDPYTAKQGYRIGTQMAGLVCAGAAAFWAVRALAGGDR